MAKQQSESEENSTFTIRVVPRAKKSEIAQVLDDGSIKIRLTAPPVEGKANIALVKLLADVLGVSPSKFDIISGRKGRNKVVKIRGVNQRQAQMMIENKID